MWAILAFSLTTLVWLVAACASSNDATVPRVVGMPVDRAVNTVSQEGFPVSVSRLPSRETPGEVISQTPTANTSASEDTTVELVVSTGEFAGKVPDVTGQKVDAATSTVQGAGFVVLLIGQADAAAPGTVFQTQPAAGEVAAIGSDVQLMVSKGPATIDVPDVVGKKAGEAVETLSAAGFVVAGTPVFSDKEKGLVVSQSPVGGESEAKGATISINISKGTGTVAVPSLSGLSGDAAMAQLAQLGLTGKQATVPGSAPEGTVVAQSPAAGTTVDTGSEVNFNVSDATKTEKVSMPNLIGLSRSDAQAQLDQLGLAYTVYVVPSNEPVGIVIAQSPAGGNPVDAGATVHFNTSGGP
jgi:eukaryotic-like serine/threonine-protein kinase